MCTIPKAEVAKERQLVTSPRMEPSGQPLSLLRTDRSAAALPTLARAPSLWDVIPTSVLSVDLKTIRGK